MHLIKKIFMMPLNTVKETVKEMSAKQSIFFYQVNIHQVLIINQKCKDQVQGLQLSCNKIREVSQEDKLPPASATEAIKWHGWTPTHTIVSYATNAKKTLTCINGFIIVTNARVPYAFDAVHHKWYKDQGLVQVQD